MESTDSVRELVVRVAVEDLGGHLETLEAELTDGRLIELTRGEMVIAEVRAKRAITSAVAQRELPDFMGRMKAIWGDKVFAEGYMTQAIREDRDARE